MKIAIAMLPLVLAAAGGSRREDEIGRLAKCAKPQLVSMAEWATLDLGDGFSLRLPSCFAPDPDTPRFVHGGRRWRCGRTTVDVVWGMWGTGSFGEREQCKSSVA